MSCNCYFDTQVLIVTADEELLKTLKESNKLLEQVQKGLADYLETKRLAFPRFYFLSNDEVILFHLNPELTRMQQYKHQAMGLEPPTGTATSIGMRLSMLTYQ